MSALPDPSSELARVRALFEQWRLRRSAPNQKIPLELWRDALSLLDSFPLQLLARELGVSASRLRHQRDALAPVPPEPSRPSFVSLALPHPAASAAPPPSEQIARLVLERPDGSRLALSLPAHCADRLDALCRDFLASPR
jgi:hypothetical protein